MLLIMLPLMMRTTILWTMKPMSMLIWVLKRSSSGSILLQLTSFSRHCAVVLARADQAAAALATEGASRVVSKHGSGKIRTFNGMNHHGEKEGEVGVFFENEEDLENDEEASC